MVVRQVVQSSLEGDRRHDPFPKVVITQPKPEISAADHCHLLPQCDSYAVLREEGS